MCEIIEEAFSPFFVKNEVEKIVTIIPVSIGVNIMNEDGSGRMKPINIHLPIFMGIWFALSKKIQDSVENLRRRQRITNELSQQKKIEENKLFFKNRKYIEKLTNELKIEANNNTQISNLINAMNNNGGKLIKELENIPNVYINGERTSFSEVLK